MKKKLKIYQKIILCISVVIVLVMSFSIQAFAVATDENDRPVNVSWQPIQLHLKQYTLPTYVSSGGSSQLKAEDGFRIFADNPSVSVGENQTYETVYTFYEPTDNGMTLLGTNRVTTTYVSSTETIINHFKPVTGLPGYDVNNTFSSDVKVHLNNFFVANGQPAPRIDIGSPLTLVDGISSDDISFVAEVKYYGILCYPKKSGGALYLEYSYTSHVVIPTYDSSVKFAFSLAPSDLNSNGNPTRLSEYDIYRHVYYAHPSVQEQIYEPDFFKTNYNFACKFVDLQVSYTIGTVYHNPSDDTYTELTSDLAKVQSRDIVISNPYDSDFVSFYDNQWNNAIGYIVVGLENTDWFGWLTDGIKDLLSIEVFPNFYMWTVLAIPLALSLIFWALKVFAGG